MRRSEDVKARTKARRKVDHDKELPDNAELLVELATLDEVSAHVPTAADHDSQAVPEWCELVLKVQRTDDWPINWRVPLRRHDGELLIEVLHQVLHPNAGMSIVDKLWRDLDGVLDRIMRRVNNGKEPLKRDAGEATGLTRAIAMMTNPYAPNVESIKDVAMERYAVRHGLPVEDDGEDDD